MTESKERTMEEITQEHNQLCFQVGMLSYRIDCEKEEIAAINKRLREVNQEAALVQKIKQQAEELKNAEQNPQKETENGTQEAV